MTTNIYILCGEKHSGKTTSLMRWMQGRDDVSGILSPVIEGKRYFMHIESKDTLLMEADDNEKECLRVGKNIFSKRAFDFACTNLLRAAQKKQGWLIIDEIGPLELRGEGFCDVLKDILHAAYEELNIVLVIRNELRNDVLRKFEIKNINIFKPD